MLVAELLNAVYDCFAHDDFNALLTPFLASLQVGRFPFSPHDFTIISVLQNFEPHVRALLSAVARDDELLAERLDEACVNLVAFLEYKRNQSS